MICVVEVIQEQKHKKILVIYSMWVFNVFVLYLYYNKAHFFLVVFFTFGERYTIHYVCECGIVNPLISLLFDDRLFYCTKLFSYL